MTFEPQRMTEPEALAVLVGLFPDGPVGADVLTELRSDGWDGPTETLDLADRVGVALWDVFSDNHDVLAPDGRAVHFGTWRGSGGFIADYLNERVSGASFDYMSFYMGSSMTQVPMTWRRLHRLVFRRLRKAGFDWHYSFPQLYLFDPRQLDRAPDSDSPDWIGYQPDAAVLAEQEEPRKDHDAAELDEDIARANREALEAARCGPAPRIVLAYRDIFGRDPDGWPPE